IGPAVRAALERAAARRQQLQAEAALRRSEANLRAIFESSREHLICVDRDCRVLTFNAAAARWIDEFRVAPLREGAALAGCLPPELAEECRRLLEAAVGGEARTAERQIHRGVGEPRWYEFAVTPVTDRDSVLGVCLGITDIEERKHAEEHYLR